MDLTFPEGTITAFPDKSRYVQNKFGTGKIILFIDTIFENKSYNDDIALLKKHKISYIVRKARKDNSCRINIDVTDLKIKCPEIFGN